MSKYEYTTYDPETGILISQIGTDDESTVPTLLGNKPYVPGHYDGNVYYVVNGQITPRPPQPEPQPTIEQQETMIRRQRTVLLSEVDKINPVWFASLTAQQQQELVAYRQALLDVPQQAGFPQSVTWPTKPTWL